MCMCVYIYTHIYMCIYIYTHTYIYSLCIHIMGFPGGSEVKNLPANAGEAGSIPGSGKSPREEKDNPLQYSCLGNPKDREARQAILHGVTKSWTHLSD